MNNEKILLTAIIPFVDSSEFLLESESWRLDCEEWQKKIQLILVHDSRYLKKLARDDLWDAFKRFDHVEFIEGDFGGPGNSRNQGLTRAIGDWVIFWDSDDHPLPRALIEVIESVSNQKCDYIVTSYRRFMRDGRTQNQKQYLPRKNEFDDTRWHEDGLGIWRIVFRRDRLVNCSFPGLSMGEDVVFFTRFLNSERSVCISKDITYSYQVKSKTQLTSNKSIKNRDSLKSFVLADLEFGKCGVRENWIILATLYVRLFLSALRYSRLEQRIQALKTFMLRVLRSSNIKSTFLLKSAIVEVRNQLIKKDS